MKWQREHQSDDVIDRRGSSGGGGSLGSIGMGKIGAGGLGGIIAIIAAILGFNAVGGGSSGDGGLGDIFGQMQAAPAGQGSELDQAPPPQDDQAAFMGYVLDDVQDMWTDLFAASGDEYQRAKLVLFTGSTPSGCGGATSAIGPHYCPADQHVYLDLDFFTQLDQEFGAPGDFAQAYVMAHEIGHHVQNLLGINSEVRQLQSENPGDRNELSVKMELQADCLAGIWAHTVYADNALEPGDIEEGLQAAEAVGDDRLQRQAGARVNPETWTHGSSQQRMDWFDEGYQSGDPAKCDTFA